MPQRDGRSKRRAATNARYVQQDLDSEIGTESSEDVSDSSEGSGQHWGDRRVVKGEHGSDLDFEDVRGL